MTGFYEEASVVIRRELGIGPGGLVLTALAVVVLHWCILHLSLGVQILAAMALGVGIVGTQNPHAVFWLIIMGRVVADMLYWVNTGGVLRGVQQIYSGAAFVFALIFVFLYRRELPPRVLAVVVGFLGSGVLAIIQIMDDRSALLEGTVRWTSPFVIFFFAFLFQNSEKRRSQAMNWMLAAVMLPVAMNVVQTAIGEPFGVFSDGYWRYYGFYDTFHANAYAMVHGAAFAVLMSAGARSSFMKFFWIAATGVSFAFALWTYHRGPILGFMVFIVIWMACRRQILSLGALFATVSVALLTSSVLQERFDDFILFFEESDDARMSLGSGRVGIWTLTLETWMQKPLLQKAFGSGLGSQFDAIADAKVDTHNEYLSLFYQTGPISVVLFLVLQVYIVRLGMQLWRFARNDFERDLGQFVIAYTAMATTVNAISNAWVSRPTQTWQYYFFVATALALAVAQQKARTAEDQTDRLLRPTSGTFSL